MNKYDVTPEMRERLYKIQDAAGISQIAMGKAMGFSGSYYGNLELRYQSISEKAVIAICNVFNVRREYLLTGEGPMHNPVDAGIKKITRIYADLPEHYQRCLLEYAGYLMAKHQDETGD